MQHYCFAFDLRNHWLYLQFFRTFWSLLMEINSLETCGINFNSMTALLSDFATNLNPAFTYDISDSTTYRQCICESISIRSALLPCLCNRTTIADWLNFFTLIQCCHNDLKGHQNLRNSQCLPAGQKICNVNELPEATKRGSPIWHNQLVRMYKFS